MLRETHRRSFVRIVLPAVLALGLWALAAGQARAAEEPFRIQFDQSKLQIGSLGGLGDLPLDALTSSASIDGTWNPDTGRVTVPKGGFELPVAGITDPVSVSLFVGIEDVATGTYDPQTGALQIDTKAGVWLSVDLPKLLETLEGLGLDLSDQLGVLGGFLGLLGDFTCGFAPMDLTFTTGPTSLGSGSPFVDGPAGPGALATEWSQLGPFAGRTKLLGFIDACALLKDMLPGLLNGVAGDALGGVGLDGIDLAGLLNNLNDVNLGPSGLILTRSIDESGPSHGPGPGRSAGNPKLKLRAIPGTRRIKAKRVARVRVRVKNVGKSTALRSRVCMTRVPGRKRCQRLGRIAPGKVKVRRFWVRSKRVRSKSGRLLRPKFTATAQKTRSASTRTRLRFIRR